jgi:hypothetical protein
MTRAKRAHGLAMGHRLALLLAIPAVSARAIVRAKASNTARFGLIDRRTFEACSRLDAVLYACHLRLANGYAAGADGVI